MQFQSKATGFNVTCLFTNTAAYAYINLLSRGYTTGLINLGLIDACKIGSDWRIWTEVNEDDLRFATKFNSRSKKYASYIKHKRGSQLSTGTTQHYKTRDKARQVKGLQNNRRGLPNRAIRVTKLPKPTKQLELPLE